MLLLSPSACFILYCFLSVSIHAQIPAKQAAARFFHTQKVNGRWILISPRGNAFFSTGLSCVSFEGYTVQGLPVPPYTAAVTAKYGSAAPWARATAKSMIRWGFNTLGAWSDNYLAQIDVNGRHLAYTPILNFGANFAGKNGDGAAWAWINGTFPDVFDPAFATFCQDEARKWCLPHKDDPNLLGWFIDNELRWGPDGRSPEELLVHFLNLAPHAPGRDAALNLLRQRYPDIAEFNKVWKTSFPSWQDAVLATKFTAPPGADRMTAFPPDGKVDPSPTDAGTNAPAFVADCDAFLGLLAEKYFQITRDAITSTDPNHLILGCRFASVPADPVIAAVAKYSDVISFNCYQTIPTDTLNIYARQNKPLLISEFSFRGNDSGCPNTKGAGPVVATQRDRANDFKNYVRAALSNPDLVGYHWFELVDEPKQGRFDGENSNNGVLKINGRPYTLLIERMTQTNHYAQRLISKARK